MNMNSDKLQIEIQKKFVEIIQCSLASEDVLKYDAQKSIIFSS